tara:strand:+ start:9010 stop:9366 length:357 start_codon:yes stop_codon:yes gene_type:complete
LTFIIKSNYRRFRIESDLPSDEDEIIHDLKYDVFIYDQEDNFPLLGYSREIGHVKSTSMKSNLIANEWFKSNPDDLLSRVSRLKKGIEALLYLQSSGYLQKIETKIYTGLGLKLEITS